MRRFRLRERVLSKHYIDVSCCRHRQRPFPPSISVLSVSLNLPPPPPIMRHLLDDTLQGHSFSALITSKRFSACHPAGLEWTTFACHYLPSENGRQLVPGPYGRPESALSFIIISLCLLSTLGYALGEYTMLIPTPHHPPRTNTKAKARRWWT